MLILAEQDTASDVHDVNSKLIKFLSDNQDTIAAATATGGFKGMAPFAKLLLESIQTMSNIFDNDDIFRVFTKTYRVTAATKLTDKQGIEVTHLDARYNPWEFAITIR